MEPAVSGSFRGAAWRWSGWIGSLLRTIPVAALLVALGAWIGWPGPPWGSAQVPGKPFAEDDRPAAGKVLICHLTGVLGSDSPDRLRGQIEQWLARQPEIRFIIFQINSAGTEGGKIEPAKQIAELIENQRGITSIAQIESGGQAANAAALVAIACNKLFIGRNSRIGFLEDSNTKLPDERAGDAQEARRLFAYYAARRKRAYPPSMAEALVSGFHASVYEATFEKRLDPNNVTLLKEIITEDGFKALEPARLTALRDKALIVPRDRRLTLSSEEALRYGLAEAVVEDRPDLFLKASIAVGDSDVYDAELGGRLKPASRELQGVVDFFNHPFIRFLLILGGFLGLLIEFKIPGTLIPLGFSLGCFLIFFVAGFFPATGPEGIILPYATASVPELVLFLTGMALIATEFLLLPGLIVFGLVGLLLVFASMVLAMVPPSGSMNAAGLDAQGAFLLLAGALGTGLGIFFLLLKFLPNSSLFNRSGIITHAALQGIPTADNPLEAQARDAMLVGRTAVALTPLRPAGKITLDGQILDVVAEGDFIEKGEKVRIIEATGFRAVVQRQE